MSFLAPAAFALALLIPIIIAMYLLKLRRTDQPVSSINLWQRMVRDLEANAPWQKLRRNLLLLLQLLFIALLIFGLARPFLWSEGGSGQAAILIMDISASMAATDIAPSRIEAAKDQARRLVDGLPDDATVTLITAGDGADVLVTSSRDRGQVYTALESLRAGAAHSDLTAALELASAIASRQPDTDIMILSDGRVSLPDRLALQGRVQYYPIGLSGNNQTISLLTLETVPGTNTLTAFIQVSNYHRPVEGEVSQPAARRLALYADESLYSAYDLEIQPGSQQVVLAENIPGTIRSIRAELTGSDDLPLDDQAWAVNQPLQTRPVTLVSRGNLFLETALKLLGGLQVETISPENWETRRLAEAVSGLGETSPASLTIFDTYVPVTATLPTGNLFFIAPPGATALFNVQGTREAPELRLFNEDDPLVANLSLLDDISVLDTVNVQPGGWARLLIIGATEEGDVPVLMAGEPEGRRVAILSFTLQRSDLPLNVAFPLLLVNLTGWLAPGEAGDIPESLLPGQTLQLSTPPQAASVTLTRPDGSQARLTPQSEQVLITDTGQPGIYNLGWEGNPGTGFAVNLFTPQESDVYPQQTLAVSGTDGEGENAELRQSRQEFWRPLIFLALVLLMTEWLVYHRATVGRLWRSLIPRKA